MRWKPIIAIAACSVLVSLGTAYAGYKVTDTVVVDQTNRFAYGALGSARNSADGTQYLNVRVRVDSYGLVTEVFGQDSGAHFFDCWVSGGTFAQAATAGVSDSYVYVTWDSNGRCTYIGVDNGSQFAPKAP